ncbi:hypothetical protein Rs2_32610 [Raphanus sativus]|nr:hypothetical protein Rs2_32610 [Raphanus sativus]
MDTTSNELLRRKASVNVGEKRKRNEDGESCRDAERGEGSEGAAGLKFNDFDKLREEVNFSVGQTWALYDDDKVDGMPRFYARIRKVSATPTFELRISYLEPDPDDELQIQWLEEDLPVSAGQFKLGKHHNTKDRSVFSHVVHCKEGSNTGHLTVSPRKGETWALFKNWDINWSSEPDSHRSYEYEFVEVLSDYADETGASVAFLRKAKGFASVFFRMRDADTSQILPRNIYQFSHKVPSFRLTGAEGKGLPKDAYELDQAALPETIEDTVVPSHLLAEHTASNSGSTKKAKPETIYFASKGKVLNQEAVYKLHVRRLKPARSPLDVIQYEDKKMPVGCGTYYARNALEIITADDVSHQILE